MDEDPTPNTGPVYQEVAPGTLVKPPPPEPPKTQWVLWFVAALLLLGLFAVGGWFVYTLTDRNNSLNDRMVDDSHTIDRLTNELSKANANASNLYEQLIQLGEHPKGELPGSAGATGATGATGPVGPIGPQGTPGKDGKNGANGKDGTNGLNGLDGAAGVNGTNGVDGKNGTDGAAGPAGPAGPAGADGKDGAQGPPGPVCPDGYTPTTVYVAYTTDPNENGTIPRQPALICLPNP